MPIKQAQLPVASEKSLENSLTTHVFNCYEVVSFIVPDPIKTIRSCCSVKNLMNGSPASRRSVSLQAVVRDNPSKRATTSKQEKHRCQRVYSLHGLSDSDWRSQSVQALCWEFSKPQSLILCSFM